MMYDILLVIYAIFCIVYQFIDVLPSHTFADYIEQFYFWLPKKKAKFIYAKPICMNSALNPKHPPAQGAFLTNKRHLSYQFL